jgi:hypothetical protein
MKITYDPVKRAITLADRGIDLRAPSKYSRARHGVSLMSGAITERFAFSRLAIFADV